MLTVACVYWKGQFRKREKLYDSTWVTKLQNMVARNLTIPHRFVCLTNTEVECEKIPLIHDWKGYWSKLELFRPGLFEDRVLYLDLDLLILNNIDKLITDDPFTIFKANGARVKKKEGKLVYGIYNSSVMSFDPTYTEDIYTEFIRQGPEKLMEKYWGDQDWITHIHPDIKTFPKQWIKKLKDCPDFQPTPKMKIALCMLGKGNYGKNKTALKEISWVKNIWK